MSFQVIITSLGTGFGLFFAWCKFREPYRHELFKRKHDAYRLIHDTAGQLYFFGILSTTKRDVYEDAFETARYNLMIDLFQNETIISDQVMNMARIMANRDIETITEDRDGWNTMMSALANRMRKELKVRLIHNLPIYLATIEPKGPLKR